MSKKIMLDPGHGGRDPGAVGFITEKVINLQVAMLLREKLIENYVCEVRMTREDDITVSLQERTNMANRWNADLFLSIHSNAGGGAGYEDYIFSGSLPRETINIRNKIHPEVSGVWTSANRPNRGKKRANFFVLRETVMSAVLVENGFVDNRTDAGLLERQSFQTDLAEAMARGIASALNLTEIKEEEPQTDVFFRVICGSFRERANAERRVSELKRAGFDSFIDIYRL